MCEFYDGCGHGDGPQHNNASCLESLGCWGTFILSAAIIFFLTKGSKIVDNEYYIIGTLIISAVISIAVTSQLPKLFKKDK